MNNKYSMNEQGEWIHEHSDHVEMQFLTLWGQIKYIAAVIACGGFIGGILYLWAFL